MLDPGKEQVHGRRLFHKRIHAMPRPSGSKKGLSILDNYDVASPCEISEQGMDTVTRGKWCHSCKKKVHDISQMTPNQVRVLLALKGNNSCIKITRRPDNTIVYRDNNTPFDDLPSRQSVLSIISAFIFTVISNLALSTDLSARTVLKQEQHSSLNSNLQPTAISHSDLMEPDKVPHGVSHTRCNPCAPPQDGLTTCYGDCRTTDAVGAIVRYIEGALGALLILFGFFCGVVCAVIGMFTKNPVFYRAALVAGLLAGVAFVARSIIGPFFQW